MDVFVAFSQLTTGTYFVPFEDGMPRFALPEHHARRLGDGDINFDVVDTINDIGAVHVGQTRDGVLICGTEDDAWKLSYAFNPEQVEQRPSAKVLDFMAHAFALRAAKPVVERPSNAFGSAAREAQPALVAAPVYGVMRLAA